MQTEGHTVTKGTDAARWYNRSRLNYAGTFISDLSYVTSLQVVIRWLCHSPGPSDQGHFPDDFLTAAYDHITRAHSGQTSLLAAAQMSEMTTSKMTQGLF